MKYINLKCFENYLKFSIKINKHKLIESIFNEDINENYTDEYVDVIELLTINELELVTPEIFKQSLSQSKHTKMLSDYSDNELLKMKLYKLRGYNIGYALKPIVDGYDIVSVHNNEPTIKNIGALLMKSAITNGGTHLDHFDTPKLSNLYSSMGFKEYARDHYNPIYDEDGSFKNKYGELDVIYRKL